MLSAAETKARCDQMHEAGMDVETADWSEMLLQQQKDDAVAKGSEDVHCVTPVSDVAYMRSQDLRTDDKRTTTGSTSSLTQTVVRQEAGASQRAAVALAAVTLYLGYNPIPEYHPRYKAHAGVNGELLTNTDRLVNEVNGCTMLPAHNLLWSTQDATTMHVQLRTGPPQAAFVAQHQANARRREPQEVDVSSSLTAEDKATQAAAMQAPLDELDAATTESLLDDALRKPMYEPAAAGAAVLPGAPLKPCDGSKRNAVNQARGDKARGAPAISTHGCNVKSYHTMVRIARIRACRCCALQRF